MTKRHCGRGRAAFSLVGMLVTLVCMVVLMVILMTSMNKAVTGEGSSKDGTVHSFEDKMYLKALFDSMAVNANENKGSYLVPSNCSGSNDPSQNTTANMFSAMLAQNFTVPKQLISGNEFSGYVEPCLDYDFAAYSPQNRSFWDPNFKADLKKISNVSFAHLPLFGDRFKHNWNSSRMSSRYPILGNRGPKDGVDDPNSLSYGRNGKWGGHLVFGDGHIDFVESFTPSGISLERGGQTYSDNIFKMDDGPNGEDVILSFTKSMSSNGPELQHD